MKIGSREFLEAYLPDILKYKVDISKVKIEKDNFIEENLTRRLSDIVYSIPYKHNVSQKVVIYPLLEHQSTSDNWIAFRLWKYILLLYERYQERNEALPIVLP